MNLHRSRHALFTLLGRGAELTVSTAAVNSKYLSRVLER